MQPFDALTIKAVVQEAKPLLINRRVDKLIQLGRDELLLTLRAKAGTINLFISAHTAYGRLCLVQLPSSAKASDKTFSRYFASPKAPNNNAPSGFAAVLRKHLTGATLVGVDQPTGERVVNLVFSCVDEVGTPSHKILTAEIMGRHSNLIFWDKNTEKILGASHFVTKEMSRQREVVPGLKYVRPPVPEKENIFCISEEKFDAQLKGLSDKLVAGEGTNGVVPVTLEQWLIDSYSGLGKHLAEDLVSAAQLPSRLPKEGFDPASVKAPLWQQIHEMQSSSSYKPGMALDFSRYTILHAAGAARAGEQWKQFPAVNDMVEEYFRALEVKEQFHQLRERLRSEIKAESEKLQGRLNAAVQQLQDVESPDVFKKHGDLVLANMNEIGAGQESLVCEDLYNSDTRQIEIKLNPNLSPSQNAQNFYRQFAKHRARQSAATLARQEVNSKLAVLQKHLDSLDAATGTEELKALRDNLIPRKQEVRKSPPPEAQRTARPQKQRLMQVNSSDGWTIYVGRNRHENDHLLTRLAQPNDIWLHILGQGGAHVLIRVPASKQDPPQTTLKEAALIAARMSKVSYGTKVRVVYTQIKHVKKVAKDKPGLVRYENEKTIEVDTGQPVPAAIKQVFSHRETQ